ncbi:dephospho-CoA kinase [Clostridium sp. USBA 49]|jgi:dephospho-CoA kinase|uniref:dephospho-CoA kinase n=1 Tax=Clostridium TaxID=1485 RepID=UPI000999F1D8|nr:MULTISPECIES: dephospho-CoA kinase [Clostridium]SKA75251.1 dephospho-CoA kinase [Clostridium sp. USBA 49]
MIKIGLTGGIGSGKSTVSNILKGYGYPIIDADIIARDILFKYPETLYNIKIQFGEKFFDEKGNLKRRELGNYVFKEQSLKQKLEDITLPYIKKEIFDQIEQYNKKGAKLCIVDAPTLIEVGLHKYMDYNILVWVDENTQIKRVKYRDLLSEDLIKDRIKMQMPLDKKKNYVDFIIDNTKTLIHTKEQVEEVLKKILT